MSHRKCEKKSIKPLKDELKDYRRNGIGLFLEGNPSTPKDIAKACMLAENGAYMRDYTEDERGRIAKVNFDFIKEISSE